ncbi:acyl carrier protein [Vibrio ouci]|uniref:Acyl carrier protein n=1 Tax=Vibrio ouci TaxID=2499078 RepID=A0A4Y8WHW0_9VIBR|nr:acyl carrier protein [Vibrio ouci]TFH92404.1 acyl carrier protein [Vibrio ouci]
MHLEKLTDWIIEKNNTVGYIAMDDDLIDGGLIDSLAFVEFLFLIEELSGQSLNINEDTINKVRTLQVINDNFFSKRMEVA